MLFEFHGPGSKSKNEVAFKSFPAVGVLDRNNVWLLVSYGQFKSPASGGYLCRIQSQI